ncbi:MAG TPA: uracil-DNA glycosylase [Chloroflexi bacterium]|nr:uracil-DNA glycosylase [Chloroflexota bacterium]
MVPPLPESWQPIVGEETEKTYYRQLVRFVDAERERYTVFPPENDVFNALKYTPYDQVRVMILGQDPYHDVNQAHGMAFSVRPGVRPPPSLRNIYRELRDDVGFKIPSHGYLVNWAKQGVLLLNAVLTVRAHQPASHQNRGWEVFTDAVFRSVNQKDSRVVFLLWGNFAIRKAGLVTNDRHVVLTAPHPSPLSASRGFFGCRHFSKTNQALREAGLPEIDWQLPLQVTEE